LIENVTSSIEKMRLREALHGILFAFEGDLHWYLKRANAKGRDDYDGILHQIFSTRVKLLSPFAPHISEEMWEKLDNSEMVSKSSWPIVSSEAIDAHAIQSEDFLKSIMDDISNILKITKITPKKITIYTANAFKSKAYHTIFEKVMDGQTNMGIIMKELIANPETSDIKKNPDFVQKAIKDILSEPTEIRKTKIETRIDEKKIVLDELISIAKQDFGVEVSVFAEDDSDIYDPKGKARHARPFKPAILIE
jgi:leucyl-tRNA synthetase